VSRVQRMRKESGFDVADRIRLGVSASPAEREAFRTHKEFIMGETLALEMELVEELDEASYAASREIDLDGTGVVIAVSKAAGAGAA
jgi:hypothetical protein